MRKLPVLSAFVHALKSATTNFRFAWHASWPWLLVLLPVNVWSVMAFPVPDPAGQKVASPEDMAMAGLAILATGLVSIFAFSSIAVTWHRFVLLDEMPMGLDRLRVDKRVWRYFGLTFLVALVMTAAMIPAAMVVASLAGADGQLSALHIAIYGAAVALVALPLGYRLSLVLPAVAVGNDAFSMRDALVVTKGNSLRIGALALMVTSGLYSLGEVLAYLFSQFGLGDDIATRVVAVVMQQGISWFATIVAVTTLTSLYGFFVDRRDF